MLAKVIVRKSAARGFGQAVRYIARDNPEQHGAPRPALGSLHLDCPLDTPEDRALAVSILDATAQAARRRTARSPLYHVTLAWPQDEHPSAQQVQQACAHVMQALGFAGHQAIWAIHRDTAHHHAHLIINRVHPDGHTAAVPRRDWLILDRAMREIELAQGWQHSPGPHVVQDGQVVHLPRAERKARGLLPEAQRSPGAACAAHREGGAPSFQEWAADSAARAIRAVVDTPGATWERVHQQAARYGLAIQPKGSGLVVTTTMDDGRVLAAKASQLGRWASKAALEQRLGPYQPPPATLPTAGVTYQKALDADKARATGQTVRREIDTDARAARRAQRAAARQALAARFKTEQEMARQARPAQRAALVQQHRAQRQELASMLRQERKALPEQARQTGQPLAVMRSLWALEAARQREALQQRQAEERKALSARLPKQEVWRKWLEREADKGDEAAKAALRGIRYREQRRKNRQIDGIEGEELDPLRKLTLAGLEAQIDTRRQLVLYRGADGREKFTDTGPRIVMHDRSDESLEAALRMAAQKFGGKVDITGSAEFRERAARQAVRLGIKVVDADLQQVVLDERARMQAQRAPQRTAELSPAAVDEAAAPHSADALRRELDALHAALQRQWRAIERGGSIEWLHKARKAYQRQCSAWEEQASAYARAGGDRRTLPELPHERQRGRGMGR
jgi:hypothetical protein